MLNNWYYCVCEHSLWTTHLAFNTRIKITVTRFLRSDHRSMRCHSMSTVLVPEVRGLRSDVTLPTARKLFGHFHA